MGDISTRIGACRKAWVAVRFVVFGVGGFIAMFGFGMVFLFWLFDPPKERQLDMNPILSLLICAVGAVMTLFGVGEWGKWGYLCLFLSMPASLSLLALLNPSGGGKELGILFPVFAVLASYGVVRAHYRRRALQRSSPWDEPRWQEVRIDHNSYWLTPC